MFEVFDLVKVVTVNDDEQAEFLGAEGIINEVNGREYPYSIIFFDKRLREKSIKLGQLIWKDYNIEGL